jgi:hypothetical protein
VRRNLVSLKTFSKVIEDKRRTKKKASILHFLADYMLSSHSQQEILCHTRELYSTGSEEPVSITILHPSLGDKSVFYKRSVFLT